MSFFAFCYYLLLFPFFLCRNSSYGVCLLNKQKFTQTKFIQGERNAALKINDPRFKALNVIDNDLYEVESGHKTIKMDLPIYLGFEILQNAKIRMLAFYYDFLSKFIHPSDMNCILSDTDSIYISLTGKTMKETVMPHKSEEFEKHLTGYCGSKRHPDAFLCRECCDEHIFQDSKFPNLFKVSATRRRIIMYKLGDFFFFFSSLWSVIIFF